MSSLRYSSVLATETSSAKELKALPEFEVYLFFSDNLYVYNRRFAIESC